MCGPTGNVRGLPDDERRGVVIILFAVVLVVLLYPYGSISETL